jgi:hypothetical protein
MKVTSRAATFVARGIVALALAGASAARAQTQPPPFAGDPAAPRPRTPEAQRSAPPPSQPAPQARPTASPAPAPPADDDTFDDPKVHRRLGPRITVPPPPAPVVPVAPTPPPVVRAPPPERAAPAPAPPPPPTADTETTTPTVVRPYAPGGEEPFRPIPPRLKLGFRRFEFVQIGASSAPSGVAARETFNNVAVDVYPVSNIVRVGLSSSFGWQSGQFLVDGDYFAMQSFSLGGQYRDLGRFIPFAEAFTGVGYMRRLQFDRTIPTAFWQFGADAGVEIYAARTGYLSLAIGYLRPVNGFAVRQQFTSIFVDTWSFKIGIGI